MPILIYPFEYLSQSRQQLLDYMKKQLFRSVKGDVICLKIQAQNTQSLILDVPLNWQINKIKCLLISKVPSVNFDCFHFTHDHIQLPGKYTLLQAIQLDNIEDCRQCQQYKLTIAINKKESNQFDNYYLIKVGQLFSSFRGNPFQPLLNQRYYLVVDLLELGEFQNTKQISQIRRQMVRLQNLRQIRQEKIDQARAQNRAMADLRRGRQDNRGMQMFMHVLSMLQMFCLGYLLGILLVYMNLRQYAVLLVILSIIGCIEIMRKISQRPQQVAVPNHPKPQSKTLCDSQQSSELPKHQHLPQEKQKQSRKWVLMTVQIWLIQNVCLLLQILISFTLSLFPNWTMQLHLNFFRITHLKIHRKINQCKILLSEYTRDSIDPTLKDSPSE